MANELRRAPVNQTCSISLPSRLRSPAGQEPSPRTATPRRAPRAQTVCVCQRVIGPPGVGPRFRRGMLNMAPTRLSGRPRTFA
jgi:hypothetical protein